MMEEGSSRRCSTNLAPPILDTVFTGTHLAGAAWGLGQPVTGSGGAKVVRDVAAGADLALAAVHLISAIYGYSAATSCRDARRPEAPLGEGDATEAYGEAP